jgi:hypothetical protein
LGGTIAEEKYGMMVNEYSTIPAQKKEYNTSVKEPQA